MLIFVLSIKNINQKENDTMKNVIRVLVLCVCILGLVSVTVYAERVDVEGGTWDYGFDGFLDNWLYSKYYHPTEIHGSSVLGDAFVTDYNKFPKEWSNANTPAAIVNNHAYYCVGYRADTRQAGDYDLSGLNGAEVFRESVD